MLFEIFYFVYFSRKKDGGRAKLPKNLHELQKRKRLQKNGFTIR